MKRSLVPLILVITLALHTGGLSAQQPKAGDKPVPVSFSVETEGSGPYPGHDLTTTQLRELERLLTAELSKVPFVSLIVKDDSTTHLHVAVVARQIDAPNGENWMVASSAIEIATDKNQDLLVTHDVLIGSDLASLAHSIAFPLGSLLIRWNFRFGQ